MSDRLKPTLWVIIGATGTGKTALSIEVAKKLKRKKPDSNPQIVNADAMQFYRGMDIGTAKITETEKQGFEHHLFSVLEVTEEATVAWYQPLARKIVREQLQKGNDVIVVGGSGLYVSSLIYEFKFPPRNEALRNELEISFANSGLEPLLVRLKKVSPEVYERVDKRNPRRVIRALEVAELGHRSKAVLPEAPKYFFPKTKLIGVHVERENLVEALDKRVEKMWSSGFEEEVRGLIDAGIETGPTSSRAIGYSQMLQQIHGEINEEEAKSQTKQLTKRYARRQVSWFKRYRDVEWLTVTEAIERSHEVDRLINERE